jgi:hypothetical protein
MSSSSVAAPAVDDKHAELLKMVNKCNHYKCTLAHNKAQSHVKRRKKNIFLTFAFVLVAQWCARSVCTASWL